MPTEVYSRVLAHATIHETLTTPRIVTVDVASPRAFAPLRDGGISVGIDFVGGLKLA